VTRLAIPILALALGAGAAFGLVSCGGDEEGLLPGDNADEIVANLNSVEQDIADGDCDGALDSAAAVEDQIDSLGNEVDAQLKQRLSDGVDRLVAAIPDACQAETTTPPTTTTTTETTDTTTTDETTDTTTTDETTDTTTTTSTAPTTTAPPTGEGGGTPAPQGGAGPG